jgi:hypothetical protein
MFSRKNKRLRAIVSHAERGFLICPCETDWSRMLAYSREWAVFNPRSPLEINAIFFLPLEYKRRDALFF